MPNSLQELKSSLSHNIRALRKAKGLAQERLGLEAGVDRTIVSKIEREIANPSLGVLFRLAQRLEVNVAELLVTPPNSGRKRSAR